MIKRTACQSALGLISLVIVVWCSTTRADDGEVVYPRGYDGFQASADAQAYWDTRRRDAINRQIGWNELFKWRAATAQPSTLYYDPHVPGPWAIAGDALDPWPYAYGRIIGYGFYDAVPQPIGRREVQTGPNRWESFPVYAEDVDAVPAPIVAPPPVTKSIAPPPKTDALPPTSRGREF